LEKLSYHGHFPSWNKATTESSIFQWNYKFVNLVNSRFKHKLIIRYVYHSRLNFHAPYWYDRELSKVYCVQFSQQTQIKKYHIITFLFIIWSTNGTIFFHTLVLVIAFVNKRLNWRYPRIYDPCFGNFIYLLFNLFT